MLRKIKMIILMLFLSTQLLASVDMLVQTIDNSYDNTATLGNWEKHSKYIIRVVLHNSSASPQDFNRIEANLDFDSLKLEFLSKSDNISGWSATNFFLVTDGHVQYQRAANTGESAITIPGNSDMTLYEVVIRVKDTASLGSSAIDLDPNFSHVLYNIADLTGAMTNLTATLVSDITAPVTRGLPASNTHLNQSTSVTLEVNPNTNTNCYDLQEIRYTTDGIDPSLSSPVYTAPIPLQDNNSVTLKWRGVDTVGNQESIQTNSYRVDTIDPTLFAISTFPVAPCRLNKNSVITINFSAQDEVAISNVSVKVGNNNATLASQSGNNYVYRYNVIDNNEGWKTITIRAEDHASNYVTDTSQQIFVDNTPPTYSILSISPIQADIGTTVTFRFEASEELNLANSNITIGSSSCVFVSKSDNRYIFRRTIDGTESSGWILVNGADLAGNTSFNLENNSTLLISGYDLLNNYGEATASFNINYGN